MKNEHAFSLVEVTLALGIISFGLVSVLGLMPIGLNAMRRAMDSSIEEQIVRKITGELLLTPYSRLTSTMVDKPFYFDEQGINVQEERDARFLVTVKDGTTVYPGSSGVPEKTPVTDSVRMLQVRVVSGGNVNTGKTSCYRILVANTGT